MRDWYQDESFWKAARTFMFAEERWTGAATEVEAIIERLGVEPPARVLDLACGPGRHALEFARRGYRVTGVDLTSSYLETARRRAEEDGLELELVRSDMREFVRPETFDLAVNLFTSFGFFEDPEDDLRVLRNMATSLRPGGRVVLDLMGKEVLARIFQARDWSEIDGELWLFERSVTDAWSWMENRWIRIRDGRREEYSLSHRLYAGSELADLLTRSGLDGVRTYGSLTWTPYDQKAERLVLLARKAG